MAEQKDLRDEASQTAGTRAEWVKPKLQRISAGSAELGATPVQPEGLAMGS